MRKLDLDKLKLGFPGINRVVGQNFHQATVYCMVKNGHKSGIEIKLKGKKEETISLTWEEKLPNDIADSWNDEEELTEYAATGLALLIITELTPYLAVRRCKKGSGGDYWLAKKQIEGIYKFEAMLEISGIQKETSNNSSKSRLNQKKKQLKSSPFFKDLVNAFVIVSEFSKPVIHFFNYE